MGRPRGSFGSKHGIVYCSYCKKQVIRGVDSRIRKDGYLTSYHVSCFKWFMNYCIEYAYILMTKKYGEVCVCCGSPDIECGHIVRPPIVRYKNKATKTGLFTTYLHCGPNGKAKDAENGLMHPLCRTCNMSSGGADAYCLVHSKYIGVWNYLPHIDDLESLPYYKALEEVNSNETQTHL